MAKIEHGSGTLLSIDTENSKVSGNTKVCIQWTASAQGVGTSPCLGMESPAILRPCRKER